MSTSITGNRNGNRKDPAVVIIGAGMTGILLVIKLKEAGINNITLLEKKDSVGGTWRENTYPGVACDVPAHAYTYSFAANPEWSSVFAPGKEIHQYFIDVWKQYGVDQYTHFNEAVTSCRYEEGGWTVKTGKNKTYHADLLFTATGLLHKPVTPYFPGKDSFVGDQFHSAEWDHSIDLKGKRIGCIGTGSSAAQYIPELVGLEGADVTVFQRTPQWIVNTENRSYSEKEKQKFRDDPGFIEKTKHRALYIFEQGTTALTSTKFVDRLKHRLFSWNAKRYLKKSVRDPELLKKLTPDYKMGCKRVIMNSTFYDAIQQPNAHLVTEGIDRIEPNGIRTVDGKEHELDVIIYGTGFDPAAYMRPMEFTGRNGLSIDEAWSKKIQAYRSMLVPGFPNYICMLGPNSPIGNYSVIAMSEVQADYALQLVKHWQAGELQTIEAKPGAMQRWNAMLRERMGNTVWASGCNSWYLDVDGDPLTWPDTWQAWVALMQEPELDDFYRQQPESHPDQPDRKVA